MAEDRKEYYRIYQRAWRKAHKDYNKEKCKNWYQSHKEEKKAYNQEHKEERKKWYNDDVNSLGEPKANVRARSRKYLNNHGTKINGYEIHHCFTYNDHKKFIYCSKEIHKLIHSYLREHNIPADSNHYEQIKHLLDDSVVLYGFEI